MSVQVMEKIEQYSGRTQLFVFDLEFIGDVRKLETCRIWEIAVFSIVTNSWFIRVVDPDPGALSFPEPPIPEIPPLTRAFLTGNRAQVWGTVCKDLVAWMRDQITPGCIPVLISHNTFRADKPVLELECRRFAMRLPLHWYFFDSLHYARSTIHNPVGNYSLSALHRQMFAAPIKNVHRAQSDVVACTRILSELTQKTWQLQGPMYPAYSTSLRSIRWIGRKAESILYMKNVRSVESLFGLLLRNIRTDYLAFNMGELSSVRKTMMMIFADKLPKDNITNITAVVNDMRTTNPYSYTFMLSLC